MIMLPGAALVHVLLQITLQHGFMRRYQLPDIVFYYVDEQPWARVVSDVGVGIAAIIIAAIICAA